MVSLIPVPKNNKHVPLFFAGYFPIDSPMPPSFKETFLEFAENEPPMFPWSVKIKLATKASLVLYQSQVKCAFDAL